MIQRNPILDFLSHLILILGVVVVFFPIYVTFIGSTQTAEQIMTSNPISLLPGSNVVESYRFALFGGKTEAGASVAPSTRPTARAKSVHCVALALSAARPSFVSR